MARGRPRTVSVGSGGNAGHVEPVVNAGGSAGDPASGGDDGSGIIRIDPASIGDGGNSGGNDSGSSAGDGNSGKRKYTRRTSKTGTSKTLSVDVLSAVLFSSHMMLAGITKVHELALAESESEALAKALTAVNAFYNVEVAEKTLAWINLSMVAGGIYGARIASIAKRRAEQRAERRGPRVQTEARERNDDVVQPSSTEAAYAGIPDDFMPGFPGMGPVN